MRRFLIPALIGALSLAVAAPTTAAPGEGDKYKLTGNAKDDIDPQNPANEVISFDTDPPAVNGVDRKLDSNTNIMDLDNQVEVKYLFVGRTCSGGSPRFQLQIDGNGDGKFNQAPGGPDQNAFGPLGDVPFGGFCPMDMWRFEDMTNDVPKWDISQFGGGQAVSWDAMEAFLNGAFPNHRVLMGSLVDDSSSFDPSTVGCAYFDALSIGAGSVTKRDETSDSGEGKKNNDC